MQWRSAEHATRLKKQLISAGSSLHSLSKSFARIEQAQIEYKVIVGTQEAADPRRPRQGARGR